MSMAFTRRAPRERTVLMTSDGSVLDVIERRTYQTVPERPEPSDHAWADLHRAERLYQHREEMAAQVAQAQRELSAAALEHRRLELEHRERMAALGLELAHIHAAAGWAAPEQFVSAVEESPRVRSPRSDAPLALSLTPPPSALHLIDLEEAS